MDFDYSWKEPTKAQLAAFEHCCDVTRMPKRDREWLAEDPSRHHMIVMTEANRRAMAVDADIFDGPAHEMTPHTLAEMMMLAENSFWYSQARGWAETGEMSGAKVNDGTKRIIKLAGSAITRIVEHGYQNGKWWDLEAIFPNLDYRVLAVAAIIDVCRMSRQVTRHTGVVHSAGLAYLPQLLVPRLDMRAAEQMLSKGNDGVSTLIVTIRSLWDPETRKQLNTIKRKAAEKVRETYKPAECIHPECDNPVAPKGIKPREGHFKNYRGTGACQRGHNSYYCTKCQRPHGFTSKVGKSHYKDHYGGDFTKERSDEIRDQV